MLIDFTFSNYRCYRDEVGFSMVAGKVRSFKESLIPIPGERYAKLLPLTAIYGPNASGKSTFVHALQCLQRMVEKGEILSDPFRLDKSSREQPTRFCVVFAAGGKVWEYVVAVRGKLVEQELLEQRYGSKKCLIFKRTPGGVQIGERLHRSVKEKSSQASNDDLFFNEYLRRLDKNVLFLHHAQSLQLPQLSDILATVRRWFLKTLCLIKANSRYVPLAWDMFQRTEAYEQALVRADTGIAQIGKREVKLEQLNISQSTLDDFRGRQDKVMVCPDHSYLIVKDASSGDLKAFRCFPIHEGNDGSSVPFTFQDESDGTRRLIHLLPMILAYDDIPRVFVVDELDRSLHTQLSKLLIESHRLLTAEAKPRQLIFTTHDVMLMEQDLLRRDEMWATEKDREQVSHLISFEEFIDIRKDKDIRKSYLMGRMGGIPNMTSLT